MQTIFHKCRNCVFDDVDRDVPKVKREQYANLHTPTAWPDHTLSVGADWNSILKYICMCHLPPGQACIDMSSPHAPPWPERKLQTFPPFSVLFCLFISSRKMHVFPMKCLWIPPRLDGAQVLFFLRTHGIWSVGRASLSLSCIIHVKKINIKKLIGWSLLQ